MPVSKHLKASVRGKWSESPPADWQFRPWGEVLRRVSRPVNVQDDVCYRQPVIRRGHGGIQLREEQLGRDILTKRQFSLSPGDWLMSKVQILHRAYGIVPASLDGAIASGSYYAFRPSEHLDLRFLWYLSHHPAFHQTCALASVGVVIEKMVFRVEDWQELDVLLPPVSEQRKIVDILSSVDDAIAATRKVMEQTKRVKQGLLQTLMTRGIGHTRFKTTEIGRIPETWEVVTLKEVARITSGATPKVGTPQYYEDGTIPFLKINDLTEEGPLWLDQAEAIITEAAVEDTAVKVYPRGTVLLSMYGTIGAVRVVSRPMAANQAIAAFLDLKRISPLYLAWWLVYRQGYLQSLAVKTSQANISGRILKSTPVPVPSVDEQDEITSVLGKAMALEGHHHGVASLLERLKDGLMQDLLTGRVRVHPD